MYSSLCPLNLTTATVLIALTASLTLASNPLGISAALAQTPIPQDRKATADRLYQEGVQLSNQAQYPVALEKFQQALAIYRQVEDRQGKGDTFRKIGDVYYFQSQLPKALEFYQQSLGIWREVGKRKNQGMTLNDIGFVYHNLGQYSKALASFQEALTITKEVGDRLSEGATLNNIGSIHKNLGQYPKALEFYQQALTIFKEVDDRPSEGTTLNNIGSVYERLGQYPKALASYQQALVIHRKVEDRPGEGAVLNNIGSVCDGLGQYPKALASYQQALAIHRELRNRSGEGATLNNIGAVYLSLGQYPQALASYQQALVIRREIGDRPGEGTTLNNIGSVFLSLGQYPEALKFYQQTLVIFKEIGNRPGEGTTLNNIGSVYDGLGQYPKALQSYQQALVIRREVGDRPGEGITLNNIGLVYDNLGQYPKALQSYQQALASIKEVGNRSGEGKTLNNIGTVYLSLGQYPKALEFFQQALAIRREVGDRSGEGATLNNIGYTLNSQQEPELAVVFYKQSVNVIEAIRQDLQVLPQEQQVSYTRTIANTYRDLADLLLQKDRVLEAQQVLDLLKVQELGDYLKNVRGNQKTAQGVENLPPEQQILSQYSALQEKAIQLGKELTQLRKLPEASRTPAQQQRIAQLVKTEEEITKQFNAFIDSPPIIALTEQLSRTAQQQNLALEDLNSLRDNLKQLDNAVLLYPLILDDRLELILTTPDSPPVRRTVSVKREDLNRAIVEFRKALQDPTANAKAPAQTLYNWLIKPLETDLKQAKAQTIIYAPDGQLRYIPLSALYDGQQWLVERYRFNNITARSLTDLNTRPQTRPHVLAAAFAQGNYRIQVGQRQFAFSGLPFAGREVDNLVATLPGTTKLLDNAFSRDATVPKMNEHNIVHLATHAAFVVGQPEESFILFGNGERVNLKEVGAWSLGNVDLVVLSACETGLGGQLGNGEEILGLGYQFQRTGARAAIASLWQVDDGGTQALMNAFYEILKPGNTTKAEALRQAQIFLIQSSSKATQQRGSLIVKAVGQLPPGVANRLSHPYYWAPFILIGNGL